MMTTPINNIHDYFRNCKTLNEDLDNELSQLFPSVFRDRKCILASVALISRFSRSWPWDMFAHQILPSSRYAFDREIYQIFSNQL